MEVVRHIMEGESVYPDKTPKVMIGNASCYEFTEAEIRVLRLLVEGMTYRQMVEALKVSPDCIKARPRNTDPKREKGSQVCKARPRNTDQKREKGSQVCKARPRITDQKREKGSRSVKPAPALQTQSGKREPGL